METIRDVHRLIIHLIDSTWAFSALVAAMELGLLDALSPSCTVPEAAVAGHIPDDMATALLDLLVSLGLVRREGDRYLATPGLEEFQRESEPYDILAWVRSNHFQSRELVDAARGGSLQPGWSHTDPEILQAQGETGRGPIHAMAAHVFPLLPGLEERLHAPDAQFLDVGMGVGIMSIELCRLYPHLQAVGLEPGTPQAAEARANITAAGLEDRIQVRSQRLQDLADRAAYDLVYLPQVFMPAEVVIEGLGRVYQALRPGGWIFAITVTAPGDTLHSSVTRLTNVVWGGSPLTGEDLAELVRAAGFESVEVSGPSGILLKSVMGRRPL